MNEYTQTIAERWFNSRMRAMLGMKNVGYANDTNHVSAKVGKNPGKWNYLKIAYDAGKDLYELVFIQTRKFDIVREETFENIYAEDVEKLIGTTLKMDTRL